MDKFQTIVNPLTNRKININSSTGRQIVKQYIQEAGASECNQYHGEPVKCQSMRGCSYVAAEVKGKLGQCRKVREGTDEEGTKNRARVNLKFGNLFDADAAKRFHRAYERNKLNQEIEKRILRKRNISVEQIINSESLPDNPIQNPNGDLEGLDDQFIPSQPTMSEVKQVIKQIVDFDCSKAYLLDTGRVSAKKCQADSRCILDKGKNKKNRNKYKCLNRN